MKAAAAALVLLLSATLACGASLRRQLPAVADDPPASHACIFTLSASKLSTLEGAALDSLRDAVAALSRSAPGSVDIVAQPGRTEAGAYIKGMSATANRAFCTSIPIALPAALPAKLFGEVRVKSASLLPLIAKPGTHGVSAAKGFPIYGANCGLGHGVNSNTCCGCRYIAIDDLDAACW